MIEAWFDTESNEVRRDAHMNAAQIAAHIATHRTTFGGNVTRMTAWLTAHATLSDVVATDTEYPLFQANFMVRCTCCGEFVNGTMIALDHVNNDGHADTDANGKRLAGSKLAEAWLRAYKGGEAYRFELQSCCANCNNSKNATGGECMCRAAVARRSA